MTKTWEGKKLEKCSKVSLLSSSAIQEIGHEPQVSSYIFLYHIKNKKRKTDMKK